MPSIIKSQEVERILRDALRDGGYGLNKARGPGETGTDIIANKGNELIHIEVISFKSSPPARSKDFYQVFFRAISRLDQGATRCVIALPIRFENGFSARVNQYRIGWQRISNAFPELEIWLVDSGTKHIKKSLWSDWNKGGIKQPLRKRNWLVEDNLVALYIALYGYKNVNYNLKNIQKIIPHKGFPMRIQQFIAIHTKGEKGLSAGLKSPLLNEVYKIFKTYDKTDLARLANLILKTKLEQTAR